MLRRIDKKYLFLGGIIGGLFVLLLLVMIIVSIAGGGKESYKDIENRLRKAAINYYEKHEANLPKKDGTSSSVSMKKLISSGEFKSLDENSKCDGDVMVTNNNDHYIYLPKLDCGKDYETEILSEKIIEIDEINEVDEGLHEVDDEYIYRGENVNNYLEFAGKLWRIIKITEDGQVRIISSDRIDLGAWDDRYNVDKKYNVGINTYPMSRIKEKLSEIYNDDKIFNANQRSVIATQNLCVAPRGLESEINDGSIECGNTFDDQPIGLIQVNEYITPSLDSNCKKPSDRSCANYNYLSSSRHSYWTMTADADTSYKVYAISSYLDLKNASGTSSINPVINLTKNLIYKSGTGTEDDPYKFKMYKKNN